MESERVELVRRAYAAWSADDIDAVVEMLHPDVAYRYSGLFPDAVGEAHGREEVREFWRTFRTPWERIRLDPEDLTPAGERVVVRSRFVAEGRSGVRVDMPISAVFSFRDGLISEYRGFRSHADAVAYAAAP